MSLIFSDNFTGSTIDTSKWTETDPGSAISQNNSLAILGQITVSRFTDKLQSVSTVTSGTATAQVNFTWTTDSNDETQQFTMLYVDTNNYATICNRTAAGGFYRLIVRAGGSTTYDLDTAISKGKDVKITYDISGHDIKFWYWNGSAWTQMGTTQNNNLGSTVYSLFTVEGSVTNTGANPATYDDFYLSNADYSTQYPTIAPTAAIELINTTLYNDANLVAYYRLENTNDSKASFNLTNNNTVAFNAAKFNNGADYGSTNTNKSLTIANKLGITGGNITFLFWFKASVTPAEGVDFELCSQSDGTNFIWYAMRYQRDSGNLQVRSFRNKSGVANQNDINAIDLGTTGFHMMAMTYDGTTLKSYVDGSLLGSGTAASGSGSSGVSDNFAIGAAVGGGSDFTNGIIDDVAVFSRALSATEILNHYNGTDAINSFDSLLLAGD